MTLASRVRALRDDRGELIDLSALETQILGLTYYPVTYFQVLDRPWRSERRPTVPGVAEAADGLVALGCGTAQQWFDLCAMSGHDEWIDENSPLSITEQANLHASELYEWVRSHKVDDVRDLASAFRIPNSPVGNGKTSRRSITFGIARYSPAIPATVSSSRSRPIGSAVWRCRHRSRHRGWANTPTPIGSRRRRGATHRLRNPLGSGCRSMESACWT